MQEINAEISMAGHSQTPAVYAPIISKRGMTSLQSTATAGGYLTPDDIMPDIGIAIKEYGGLMRLSTVLETKTGRPLVVPLMDDTANVGELLAEEAGTTELTTSVNRIVLKGCKFTSGIIKVSREFLRDTVNGADWIRKQLETRILRAAAPYLIGGDGISSPRGIKNDAFISMMSATAGQFDSLAQFMSFEDSLDPVFKNRPKTAFLCNQSVCDSLVKLSIAGRPVFWPNLSARARGEHGADWLAYGVPIVIDNDVPVDAGTNANPWFYFGDFSKYIIRITGVVVYELNELYVGTGQIGFVAHARIDGGLVTGSTAPIVGISFDF